MKLAVLFYRDSENPEKRPGHQPVQVREIHSDLVRAEHPWVEMTPAQYQDYCERHRAEFEAEEVTIKKRAKRNSRVKKVAKAGAGLASAGGALTALVQYLT